MRAYRHLVIGAAAGMALANATSPQDELPVIATCALGSLLPDLDHQGSTASSLARTILKLGSAGAAIAVGQRVYATTHDGQTAVLIGAAVLLVGLWLFTHALPYDWLEHRGPLHSPVMAMLVGATVWMLTGDARLTSGTTVGWLSHLAADEPTYMGLPLLWPVSRELVHLTPRRLRWRSGNGLVEWPLAIGCLMLALLATGGPLFR